ncbi:MAG: phenylalanine--tRNA ligase subunit beta [Pyrinomonadaceae bacterium]
MNISYNWLRELVDFDLSVNDLAVKLTSVGLAVEGTNAHGDDWILDVDLTSNRPDCLSHLGVAREISVISNSKFQVSDSKSSGSGKTALSQGLAGLEDAKLCPRFTARLIRNVKVGPSPEWLVDRLEAVGERSINNIADATNYVMLELGQPMHAFDYDKIAGKRLIVRRAHAEEKITTLDEIERNLDSSMLAICDADEPVAIAGIMGGLDSSITDSTVNVLLEVAYFDRANLRATSRKLNLTTEASYRFERGVDIENLVRASIRATELICEIAGGEMVEFQDIHPSPIENSDITTLDLPRAVKRLTGLEVGADRCGEILSSLGIVAVDGPSTEPYRSPSWRHDLAIEEDLVEEVARHVGFDQIESKLPPALGAGEYQATEMREKGMRQALLGLGFSEALSYSFVEEAHDTAYETVPGLRDEQQKDQFVTLKAAVISGAVRMRPTLLPGLLDAIRHNLNHQNRDLKLFEIGKAFATTAGQDGLPNEQKLLAVVITGGEAMEQRAIPARDVDFYDVKGAVECAISSLGVDAVGFSPSEVKHLQKGQASAILVDGENVGYLGRLSGEVAAQYKFKSPIYLAEINLQHILQLSNGQITYHPLAKYPSIIRDVSLIVSRKMTFSQINSAVLAQNAGLCRSIVFVDIYDGKGLAKDERSLTVRLEYRSDEHTLVESEVEALHEQIITGIENSLGIRRRFQ